MIKHLCYVFLASIVTVSVSSNPLNQLVQNVCQPTSYSNPTSIPVAIQPSNNNLYPQGATVQVSPGSQSPLGETLNQIILSRVLSNPSLQKIIDPNTKLYNQNGEEVQRQVRNTGVPNVINNYFIVPPEFFNLNETAVKPEGELVKVVDKTFVKRPNRTKRKRRPKIVELSSAEEDEVEIITPVRRRKQKESENVKRKRNRIKEVNKSVEVIDDYDESQEFSARKERKNEINERKHRFKKKNKEEIDIPIIAESDEKLEELEKPTNNNRKKEIKRSRNTKSKSKTVVNEKSQEISEPNYVEAKQSESFPEIPLEKRSRKEQRYEKDKESKDKILKNIEIPTDISNHDTSESRQTRDSKRKKARKESPQIISNAAKKKPQHNITPFSDDVLKNFFPYMPMGNFNNPYSNYPYNFDHYYQYLNPIRNHNDSKNKKKRKNQSNSDATSNTHTIEIKLKPRKKSNTTEIPITENPNTVHELSIEVEQSTESFEKVTDIPMEMPHKVSPAIIDITKERSKENYETFSKLEDLHEFITPELGKEDEVPIMNDNGIINDYYPVFDVDVFYNPYAEQMKNLEDDRYFYETGNEVNIDREQRKLDGFEESKGSKRDTNGRKLENPDFNTKKINKFDYNEYLDHIATFSDVTSPEIDTLKSSAEIRRVKIPSKNIRVKTENVETVFAGSKVAKYGVPLDETVEDSSTSAQNSDESSFSSAGQATYVVAKSLGRPEDYW